MLNPLPPRISLFLQATHRIISPSPRHPLLLMPPTISSPNPYHMDDSAHPLEQLRLLSNLSPCDNVASSCDQSRHPMSCGNHRWYNLCEMEGEGIRTWIAHKKRSTDFKTRYVIQTNPPPPIILTTRDLMEALWQRHSTLTSSWFMPVVCSNAMSSITLGEHSCDVVFSASSRRSTQ